MVKHSQDGLSHYWRRSCDGHEKGKIAKLHFATACMKLTDAFVKHQIDL